MSLFERVKGEANLVELFRDRGIVLKRSGTRYSCLCPFHPDRNPSCYVSKSHFKCFACGSSGDAIAFVSLAESMSQGEALRWLCERYGIRGAEEVLDLAASAWHERLVSSPQLVSLAAGLGFTSEMVRAFGLGFVDASTEARILSNPEARAKGLVGPSGGLLLTGRIAIPLRDLSGRVLAFQARAIDKGARAKYMMSYNHPAFKRELYLFDTASYLSPKTKGLVYLVEGPKDAMAIAVLGSRAWAFLGASFSREQVKEVERRLRFESLTLIVLMDADEAGAKAARAIVAALPRDLWERGGICGLPRGSKDVSEMLAKGLELADLLREPGGLKSVDWRWRRYYARKWEVGTRKAGELSAVEWRWQRLSPRPNVPFIVPIRQWFEMDAARDEGPPAAVPAACVESTEIWSNVLSSVLEEGYMIPARSVSLLAFAAVAQRPLRAALKVPSSATLLLVKVATLGLYAALRLRQRRLAARRGPLGQGEALAAIRWAELGRSLMGLYRRLVGN